MLWLASDDVTAQQLLTPPLTTPTPEEDDFVKSALEILKKSCAISEARTLALRYANEARTALAAAANHSSKPCNQDALQALNTVIDFAIERMR